MTWEEVLATKQFVSLVVMFERGTAEFTISHIIVGEQKAGIVVADHSSGYSTLVNLSASIFPAPIEESDGRYRIGMAGAISAHLIPKDWRRPGQQ